MENNETNSFNSLLNVYNKAKNDSQRFAALLITTKALNANLLTEKERLELFKAIGFQFPIGLISTSSNSDTSDLMIEIGISILSSFSTDKELSSTPEMINTIPKVLKIFVNNMEKKNESVLLDCLQYLLSLSTTEEGKSGILHQDGLNILCEYYCKTENIDFKNLIFTAVVHLLSENCQYIWEENREILNNLLCDISTEIKIDQSDRKFKLIQKFYSLLQTLPKENLCYFYDTGNWLENSRIFIYEILCSKISQQLRNPVLLLASCLSNLYGLKWTVSQDNGNSKLPLILIRLICVEINITLHQCTNAENNNFDLCKGDILNTLLSCFIIFESACKSIAEFDQEISDQILNFEQIKSLEIALSDVVKSIGDVINSLPETKNEFHLACLRIMGSWLNVPLYCASKTGKEIEEIVLKSFKMLAKGHCCDVVKSLSPAILNYTENAETRNEIEKNDIVRLLSDLLCDNNLELPIETSTLIVQCLIALSVESENVELYTSILEAIILKAISLKTPNDVVNKIYVSTLVLIIWNKAAEKPNKHAERFFKSLIILLHSIHALQEDKIMVAQRHLSWWTEVEQLWPILMKELIHAVRDNNWIIDVVKSTGFYDKILSLLDVVKENNESIACYSMLKETCLITM